VVSELRYKAWGEVRYESGTTPTKYTYTGQYSYTADFGLMFYNARWVDVSLGRFAQADSIVPGGVQGYDRYAYVNNSPVMFADPSGHCIVEDDSDVCGIHRNPSSSILDSAVVLIFGTPGEGDTNTLGIEDNLSVGLGVVVNNRLTIKTASHVYVERPSSATTLFVWANGVLIKYNILDIKVEINNGESEGDEATITLPYGLPGDITPAQEAVDYHSVAGQILVTTYYRHEKNEDGKVTGFVINTASTVTTNPPTKPSDIYGTQYMLLNPNHILNQGDSGGGVFYNGQLVGVNSGIDSTVVAVAPLCFKWYWNYLPWIAIAC